MQDISKLRAYLVKKTGISATYKHYVQYPPKGAFYATINGVEYELRREHIKGQADWVYSSKDINDNIIFNQDIKFDSVWLNVSRNLQDFDVKLNIKPKAYKNCQGNGWYCMEAVYEVDGLQFAYMG